MDDRRSNRLISQLMQHFAEGMETVRFFAFNFSHLINSYYQKKTKLSLVKIKSTRTYRKEKVNSSLFTKSPLFLSVEFSSNIAVA